MKLQDVILKAMAKKISWLEAAEIIGVCDRTMRRMRERYQEFGYDGLFDQRRRKRSDFSGCRWRQAERVLALYRDTYFDLSVRHFHEKLREEHAIELSYTWVKQALQGAGLVARRKKRGSHRRRRPRRPMPGMLLHIDGSKHRWFSDDRYYDLLVILDDATSEIYYAQLVEEESTRTVMSGLREVIESKGLFCALVQRSRQSFLCDPQGRREGRSASADAGWPSDERTRCANDPGLFATSAGPLRTQFRHLAEPLATRATIGRHRHDRAGERLSPGALHR